MANKKKQDSTLSTLCDYLLWLIFGSVVISGFYLYSIFPDALVALKLLITIFFIILLLAIAFFTKKGKIGYNFARSSYIELRKVVWPARQEVIRVTIMVIAMIALITLFLWALDSFFAAVISYITA